MVVWLQLGIEMVCWKEKGSGESGGYIMGKERRREERRRPDLG
jgi:hypothetical protein